MLADGTTSFDVIDSTTIGQLARRQDYNAWASAINGAWDDALRVTLALWKVGDYKVTHGQESAPYYVRSQVHSLCDFPLTLDMHTEQREHGLRHGCCRI